VAKFAVNSMPPLQTNTLKQSSPMSLQLNLCQQLHAADLLHTAAAGNTPQLKEQTRKQMLLVLAV